MPLPAPEDLIRDLAGRLSQQRGVDLGLAGTAEEVRRLGRQEGLVSARKILRERGVHLQAAAADVEAVVQRLRLLAQLAPFTEEGWPERSAEIAERVDTDPVAGLADWLEDYFSAIATVRFGAIDRLVTTDGVLPPGAALLAERCETASRAL